MANKWLDGFDKYAVYADLTTFSYAPPAASPTFSTTSGRFGGGGVSTISSAGSGVIRPDTFALELWVGYAIKVTDTNNNDRSIFTVVSPGSSNSGLEGTLTYNPVLGIFKAWRGPVNTLLGSVTNLLTTGTWNWIDVHYKYSATVGIFEVWLNGTQILNVTAANTANNSGQTSLSAVHLGCGLGTVNSLAATYDDFVINDTTGSVNNGRVGDHKIETLHPTSDATPNNGTPSTAGAHYLMVNDQPWNSTNYITMTNTSGQEELFGLGALASTPVSVEAVKVSCIAENTDAGSANLETVVVSSATELDGSSTPLTSSWQVYSTTYETDPHTSAAWTAAAVNAAQVGWKVP